MNAPAATALLLAVLAALPYRGTDADAASKMLNRQNRAETSQPTINEVYQMLYTAPDIRNHTNNPNFNLTPSYLDGLDINNSSVICCREGEENIKGAQFVHKALDKRYRKRAVSVIRKEETTTAFVMPSPPLMTERRQRKPGETGSSAPLLNYIFDTYSNTHHHKNDSLRGL